MPKPESGVAVETVELTRTFRLKKNETKGQSLLYALRDVSLKIHEGDVFGLLGPNGAGKTTLIKILSTLLYPTSGEAFVGGLNVRREPYRVRELINMISGGESCGYGILTLEENLWLFTQLYGIPYKEARKRIRDMVEVVGMEEKIRTKVSKLSTGQKQKMNFIRGFLSHPKILFLDEPTIGLDVNASREVRAFIRRWVKEHPDRTILLTTHYMQEADQICDRVAIIDRGRVLVCDTPENLKSLVQKESHFTVLLDGGPVNLDGIRDMEGVISSGLSKQGLDERTQIKLSLSADAVISDVVRELVRRECRIVSIDKSKATLEDVFISFVGKGFKEVEEEVSVG